MFVTLPYQDIKYEIRDHAAWIIINRPEVYNAFRGQTVEELIHAFLTAASDKNVSCVVLTGAGDKAFVPVVISPIMKVIMMVVALLVYPLTNCSRRFAISPSR